jgi:hypothetical protein
MGSLMSRPSPAGRPATSSGRCGTSSRAARNGAAVQLMKDRPFRQPGPNEGISFPWAAYVSVAPAGSHQPTQHETATPLTYAKDERSFRPYVVPPTTRPLARFFRAV